MAEPIFQDHSGKRWLRVKMIMFILFLLLYTIMLTYIFNAYQKKLFPIVHVLVQNVLIGLRNVLTVYLVSTILIGFIRFLLLLFFSYRQKRRKKVQRKYGERMGLSTFLPTVTVIVPVYNEEVVIEKTITSILKSNYPITEILVVDDGSTDNTASVVEDTFYYYHRVRLIRKRNGGKSSALNLGFKRARGEIVITIDADTLLAKETISHLVSSFRDPEVAAVSGNCKIGNIRNLLTLWQHIEYVTANNLERRACEELNIITVVPGSNSAWRKSAVKEVGYYDTDTLAEDTDMTIKILNKGYKIIYDDRAISYEECPEKVRAFIKQRFRWSYGILQCTWKHKGNILRSSNKILKYFAASMIFSYLLYLTSPLIDILFIIALCTGSKSVYLFFLLFYATDLLAPAYALKMEEESMKPLLWVFVQRFAYRYLIAYVTWKTVLTALKGGTVGWGKLKRSGTNTFSS